MFNTDLDAIVPMLCVTLAALASMGAEAFRKPGEKMPIGGLGIVGLIGAAASTAMLWNRNSDGFGVIVADNFGLFVTMTLVIVGILTIMFSSQVVHGDEYPKGEYYTLLLFSIVARWPGLDGPDGAVEMTSKVWISEKLLAFRFPEFFSSVDENLGY